MKVFLLSAITIGFLFIGAFSTAFAGVPVTYSSNVNGLWSNPGTWLHDDGLGNQITGVPGSGDTKFVNNVVTVSSPASNSGLVQVSGSLIIGSTFTNTGFFDGMTTNGLVNFGAVTVNTGGIYQNSGLFDSISGSTLTINTGGNFNNLGTANTHFHNEQATVNVIGTLTNQADIHQLTNGVMEVSGILDNSSVFAKFDNRFGAELRTVSSGIINNLATGIIDNAGTINNNLGSVNNSGIINNKVSTGTINNNVGTFKINSGGTLNNEESSDVNNDSLGILDNSGTVVNIGNVNNSGVLENENIFNNTSTGTIDNTKTITNKVGGTLNNEGTFDNHDKFDNNGTVDNKEDATLTNFDGGTITNNNEIQNDGEITNKDNLTNTGTLTNDNYIENEKQIDNTSGTINNTCLINNSGSVPNMGGMVNNQNNIVNTGMFAFQPGGKFTNSGTLTGNLNVTIGEPEIIPDETKIKGRIVVVTPDRGSLELKGSKVTVTHSGGDVETDTDRDNGNFVFNIPNKKESISLEGILKEGSILTFPDGRLEIHHQSKSSPVQFNTENFNSCLGIAYIELSSGDPEFKLSGKDSTPTLTGLSQLDRLAHLAALYYYFLIGLDFTNEHLTALTLDSSLPLDVIGFSNDANTDKSASHFNPNGDVALHMRGPEHTDTGKSGSTLADGKNTEYKIDTLYHELGHYLVFESTIGGENSGVNGNRNAHPDLSAVVTSPTNCHKGYAQLDSSCAFSEGFATFLSAVISNEKLSDTDHSKFPAKVHQSLGGGNDLVTDFNSVIGISYINGTLLYFPSDEEYVVSSLLWGIYGPTGPAGPLSIPMDTLFTAISNVGLTNLFQLYNTLGGSGLVTTPQLNTIFGHYDICIDGPDANFVCNVGEAHGTTGWKNVTKRVNGTNYLFSYPQPPNGPGRTEIPLEMSELVSFDVMAPNGTTIMDGSQVTLETVLSTGEKYSRTEFVYDGKLITHLRIPPDAHVNLIFTNPDYFSDAVSVTHDQYISGLGDEGQMNSLAFTLSLEPKDPCTPPISGDWVVSVSCELIVDTTVAGNVTITNNSQIEIPSGNTLTISSGNNITIEAGSGLKIISGGTLQVNS